MFMQVFILELGQLNNEGLIRWTRWSVPTSTTPPAVYHIHGSAAGAFPGVAISAADEKLKVKGLLEAEVTTTDEILDAFDGLAALTGCMAFTLELCWARVKSLEVKPTDCLFTVAKQTGLAKSINCSADTPMAGKGTSVILPGAKLLGNFGATESTALPTSHFGQLGSTLLHAEPQKSYGIGTCNLMISAHTLKTPIRPEAEQEILFKLKSGFRQGLWPVLHLQDPVGHLEMPSRAAENASKTQLLDGLKSALTAANSGRGSSLLQGVKSGTLLQQNGQLVALVQELQAVLETDKMLVVICPRAALVSEKYVRTRMRMWGAIAKYKEAIAPQIAGKPIPGQDAAEFVFYLDENCEHVTEVLVHSWLDLHECPIETCLLGELLVGSLQQGAASLPSRMQQEIDDTKPVDILQALGRLAANTAAEYMQRDNPAGNFAPMSPTRAGQAFPAATPRSRAGQAFPANAPRRTSSPRKTFTPRKTFSPRRTSSPRKSLTGPLRPDTAGSTNEQREGAEALHGLEKALSTLIAEALRHRCCDYSIDSAWMGGTHDFWRTVLAGSIHKSSVNRRLAAGGSFRSTEAATTAKLASGHRADDETSESEIQRCSLELTLPSLLHASVGLSEHGAKEFLSDSNMFVVYLEHMGIGNEVDSWFGMTKFRLGDGESLVSALPAGKGIYDLEQDDVEKMESPTRKDETQDRDKKMTGFATAVGNGIFWVLPFVMYFVPITLVGFSLYENGNLTDDFRRWLFWSFFCSFLIVGGYFNLLIHFINNHRWRFSGQAQLLAIAQSIPSALLVFTACAIPVGAYGVLREDLSSGLFSAAAFILLSLELTMLMIIGSLTTDGNLWGSKSAFNVIGVYVGQLCFNAASKYITKDWGQDVAVNLVALFIFVLVAAAVLCYRVRQHAQVWAEALQCSNVTDVNVIRMPALQLLLSFHNAMQGTNLMPGGAPPDEMALIARKSAQTLLTKTKVLRRQRLSIVFDKYCWVVPQGALMHMMITIPYWLGEWGGQGLLQDIYSNVLVMSLAYVIIAGAFCEWCWVARSSTAAYKLEKEQLTWFYIKLAGYTLMVLVRFDGIMGDAEPSSRIDSLDQFLSLATAVAVTVPLAQFLKFKAAPPVAVAIAGSTYLALHMLRKWTRQYKQARKDKRPTIEEYQVPLSSLLGQPAFSNSTFRQSDLRSALHRLQATKSKLRHKLKPHHQAGQTVVKLLQSWSAPGQTSLQSQTQQKIDLKQKADAEQGVQEGPTKAEDAKANQTVEKSAPSAVPEVWVVPYRALNTDEGAPQLYSLGVPHPDHEVLAVHVVASDTEMDQVDDNKALDDDACRRVAEALMFTTAMHHLKASNQAKSAVPVLVSSMTTSRLDAGMWENPASASSLQQRLLVELASLPGSVLSDMADRTPLALLSAIWQQLLGQVSAVGNSMWKDTDLFADMNSSTIDDAWQWLPLKARIALLHFLSDLPRLAGRYHNPEQHTQLSQALARVTEESEMTTAERAALRMASELVVCGEEVKAGNDQIAEAVALKEGVSFVARPGSPQLLAAVRARQHFLGPVDPKSPRKDANASQRGTSEDAESATSQASPTAASTALVDRRGISANMADPADASEVTLNRNVLRAYLAVEMVLGVQQAVRQNLNGTAKVVAKPAPKAQSSFTSVEITETTATQPGKVSAIATGAPAKSSTLAVAMPSPAEREAGLSAQHHEGLAVAEEIEAEFTRAQKAAHLTVRKAFNFTMQGSWRLLWLALMGDTSFWQEAMHLVDGSRGRKFLRYCAFPLMVLLQAIATLSQRRTIRAAARHGESGQVSHILSVSRQGMHHSHLTLVAGTAEETRMATITSSETTLNAQAVLSLTKGVMRESYNRTDSIWWSQTAVGLSAVRPNSASTISTAFVARKVHSIAIGGLGRRSMWQRTGLESTTLSLPVFQYYPEDKACSAWLYETDKSVAPHQKLTWFGVKSLTDGHKIMQGDTEPNMITSYTKNGRLSLFSTSFPSQPQGGQASGAKAIVGFHMKPRVRADEGAVRGAGCKIEATDDSGSPIVLLADAHFFYPVTMLSGTGSRVNYKPITPDPESNKALLLPFAAQLHITVQGQEQTWQWLLIRTKPPTLARKTHYLWPSDNQDLDCWYKQSPSSLWEKAVVPEWLNTALKSLNVPYAPSVWQEQPCIPATLKGMGSANSVRLYTMHASDTGMSRMLLWWIWKIGVNAINDIFYPAAVKPVSAVAKASTKVKTMFDGHVAPVLDGLSATIMDESLLRGEPLLWRYWTAVSWLSNKESRAAITSRKSTLQVCMGSNLLESGDTFSQLAHDTSSLAAFNTVPGNSYSMVTPLLARDDKAGKNNADDDFEEAIEESIHVVAVDSGTWPTDGGGVATCRELVLDYVQHVRWSVLSEIGNDFKQVNPGYVNHKTLDSVELLIMWDGQYPTPAQNALAAVPYTDISWRQYITRAVIIKRNFLPILEVFLMVLLKSSFLSAADVQAFSESVMQMWRYFQIHDWERTWNSPQVIRVFFAALNAFNHATVGEAADTDNLYAAYDAVQHYMKFICMPKLAGQHTGPVCHASNHGTQAMTGLIFKKLFNQALIVWDHCVYVRERLLWYDTEKAMPFLVRDTLARLHRAAAEVLYAEADLVTPCCATFNVNWEQWLGHAPETIMPVLNGLDFGQYKTVERVLAKRPTVVMMAHINPLKDIVTAIRAAKIIVEVYKVADYQLLVYGNKRQDERYCAKCERLISKLGMEDHVVLKGVAKPSEILRQGWMYLQSSISEGLPISILEAGMSGLCVVCTDVGGCAETMSDGRSSFGRLLPARNHKLLAYAQLEVMAMLPTLSNPKLSEPPPVDSDMLLERLSDAAVHEKRRLWGEDYRVFIRRKFSLMTHASQQRQAFYLTHYSRQLCAGESSLEDTLPAISEV
ncbi:hypothetical protein ABBQ38_012755 [Trebouxia sp. C0009 RCD-2024]